jgi:hypothetical protein
MPGSRHHALKLTGLVAAAQASAVLLATRALAAPKPTPSKSDNGCGLISGEAKKYCERGTKPGLTSDVPPSSTQDPLSSLAKGCAEAASWTIGKLSDAVKETANVDFTNEKFLQQYAVVFAASTILTLLLWPSGPYAACRSPPPSRKPSGSSG